VHFRSVVNHDVPVGPQDSALMLYLAQGNFVPFDRLAKFSRDALHIPDQDGNISPICSARGG